MRFSAPEHVSDVLLSTGPFIVVEGVLEVPDDTPVADLAGLSANEFVLMSTGSLATAETKPSKRSPDSNLAPAPDAEERLAGDAEPNA